MDIPQIQPDSNADVGDMGQMYLATGKQVALRRWEEEASDFSESHSREYETVGYLIQGVLEIDLDGQIAKLESGDSWLVPAGATHRYRVVEPLIAIKRPVRQLDSIGVTNHRKDL
ncbi:MAG: cupin domain-containing protein [Pirellulaceae bacterium]